MNRNLVTTCACGAIALTPLAWGEAYVIEHDVRPRVASAKIVTDAVDDSTGDVVPNVRFFAYEFGEDPTDPYFLADPGFDALPGSGLPGGSQLSFDVGRHLAYWGGAGRVSFTTPPNGESLRFNLGFSDVTVSGTSPPQPGFTIGTVASTGALHRHLNSFLQGPDSASDPAEGVYFTTIRLLSSAGSIAPSEALYLVFNNGLDEPRFEAALEYLANPLPGDANFDGVVGLSDFNILAAHFGASGRFWYQGDFNGDGTVNLQDFNLLAGHFGQTNAAPALTPEPAAGALACLAAALLLARRRKLP